MNKKVKTKTSTINHKVKPEVKQALIISSQIENRSQANMLEVMILDYCRNHNININKQQ